jgi:AraC-like DNA-binding protein
MNTDIRDEWLQRVITLRQWLEGQMAAPRVLPLRRVFDDFWKPLPAPRSSVENVVLRGLLLELALRWGHADHWAYHAEFPDAECHEDPAVLALCVWRTPAADAKAAFREWADTYIEHIERVHPRYRAVELRRELDTEFAKPLSLAKLARSRRVSVRSLQRDFQELTGVTIQVYVTERRLDTAVGLLKNTSDKVEWIANVVGWSSRKNLNRALARRRGVKPASLRAGACLGQRARRR